MRIDPAKWLTELRKLRLLKEENARLKRVVADLMLDRHILQEPVVASSPPGGFASVLR